MARAPAQTQARRLEVRLVRRLPAFAARLRGRTAGGRRRDRHRLLPRGDARRRPRARTTCRWWKARSPRRTTPSGCTTVRRQSRTLITIGACATAGGIQALRNFKDVREFTQAVYARPEFIDTLATSTPIKAHVNVDFELHGCPINKHQLRRGAGGLPERAQAEHAGAQRLRRVQAARHRLRAGARHALPRAGHPCRLRRDLSGYNRGCYGCFGPMETPNTPSLSRKLAACGMGERDIQRVYSTFNAGERRSARRRARHGS